MLKMVAKMIWQGSTDPNPAVLCRAVMCLPAVAVKIWYTGFLIIANTF